MQLSQVRVVGVGPLGDLTFPFADEGGSPRKLAILLGGGGVGKTSLLSAIAATRPGYAVAQPRGRGSSAPQVTTEWLLGDDDPTRPHTLTVASPNATLAEPEDVALLRRREQAHFDRRALEGGFAFVSFSAGRWFSRSPVLLTSPERTIGRYEVRGAASFDDASRADLARETKTALAYASIGAALSTHARAPNHAAEGLERAMREAVLPLARLGGVTFVGADPSTLEPIFEDASGAPATFDELPTHTRHLVAFAALTVRVLHAAYPGRDARNAEGVCVIDDVDLHQDAAVQRGLAAALREALPNVQWILTSSSPAVTAACSSADVLALRRMPSSRRVELYEGELALLH